MTVSPDNLSFDSADLPENPERVDVDIRVTRRDNGQPAPNGSTIIVTTSLGGFPDPTGATNNLFTRVVANVDRNGTAELDLLFDGTVFGEAIVQAQLQQSFGQARVEIREVIAEIPDAFFIEAVTPDIGEPGGGYTARILGGGFASPAVVDLGGQAARVLRVSSNSITVEVPEVDLQVGQRLTVPVTVVVRPGSVDPDNPTLSGSLNNAFTYARGGQIITPKIFSVTPTSGPNEGGTQVVIRGEGFGNEVQVFFNGGGARIEAPLESVADDRIVARTPAATGFNASIANQLAMIEVVLIPTGDTVNFPNAFQYGTTGAEPIIITSVGPNQGPWFGGTTFTVFGRGFDEPVAVTTAGIGANIFSVTGTEILAESNGVAPPNCGDVTGPVTVTNIETGEGGTGPDWIYRVTVPAVASVSPRSVSAGAGGQLVLSGSGFQPPLTVQVTGEATVPSDDGTSTTTEMFSFLADVLEISETQVTISVPGLTNVVQASVQPCTTSGGIPGFQSAPTSVDLVITNPVTTCTNTFEGAFTYGSGFGTCTPIQPLAAFTPQVLDNAAGTVAFSNESENATSFSWSFPGGTPASSSAETPPVVTYPGPGTYTVTLTASNSAGSDTDTQFVTITAPPPPPAP
ncbi:MAG: IPT/TIG domain-containing protein [Pseudomonadota bacterium]